MGPTKYDFKRPIQLYLRRNLGMKKWELESEGEKTESRAFHLILGSFLGFRGFWGSSSLESWNL